MNNLGRLEQIAENRGRKLDGSDPYALTIVETTGPNDQDLGRIIIRPVATQLPNDIRVVSSCEFYVSEEEVLAGVEKRTIESRLSGLALIALKYISVAVAVEPELESQLNLARTKAVARLFIKQLRKV